MLNLIEVDDIILVVFLLKLNGWISLEKLNKEWDDLNVLHFSGGWNRTHLARDCQQSDQVDNWIEAATITA